MDNPRRTSSLDNIGLVKHFKFLQYKYNCKQYSVIAKTVSGDIFVTTLYRDNTCNILEDEIPGKYLQKSIVEMLGKKVENQCEAALPPSNVLYFRCTKM